MKRWCRLGLLTTTLGMLAGAAVDCGWFATAAAGAFMCLVGLLLLAFTKPDQWEESE